MSQTLVVVSGEGLGRGDDELGRRLIVNFLRTIAFRDDVPETIVCYNRGVKLVEQGSPAVPMLEVLAQKGADIMLCATCVEYFALSDRLALGTVSDMHHIVEALMTSARIISV